MRIFSRFLRTRDGASTVEFALIAAPFVLIVVGILEVAMILFVNVLLEGGVRDSARFGITGYTPAGTDRISVIREIIRKRTVGLVDMSKVSITTLVYSSFSSIGQPEPFTDSSPFNGVYDPGEAYVDVNGNGQWDADMGVAGAGGPGDVVLYTVSYNWEILTGLFRPLLGSGGVFPLRASVAVRNEPFPQAAVPGGGP